jgi:hypothetical protein
VGSAGTQRARPPAMRGRAVILGAVFGTIAALACGVPRLPAPPLARQPTEALIEVPYPPPPPRVETVPAAPRSTAVWIDGEWTWQTRRWAWRPGRWVLSPVEARFTPWTTVRDRLGTLYFAEGTWRDASGAAVAEPPPLAVAEALPSAVVTPEGADVPSGPMAPLDGNSPRATEPLDAGALP